MKTAHFKTALLAGSAAAWLAGNAFAQTVPPLVNYQGRLSNPDGSPLPAGNYTLSFRIYDAAVGGALVWGPEIFDGQAALGHGAQIPVVDGYFNALLGPTDTAAVSLTNAFAASNRFVELTVADHAAISPRQQFLSAPYAFQAANAASVGGQPAATIAVGIGAANAAASVNTPSAIVKRDGSGNFSAGTVTATSFSGGGGALTGLNASQLTSGTVPDARLSANVGLQNGTNVWTGTNRIAGVLVATNANNILTGTLTGSITGSAASFTGSLGGDVTGPQSGTTVASVGGQTAASIATATTAANTAAAGNSPGHLVTRDGNGDFSARIITATLAGSATSAGSFTGLLGGDVTGSQGNTTIASVGGQSAAAVAGAVVTVNNATSADDGGAIVSRDGGGSFSAGTVSAAAVNASGAVSAGSFSTSGTISAGSIGSVGNVLVGTGLSTSSLEIGNSLATGSTPNLDFHFGVGSAQDYNVRLENGANGQLVIYAIGASTPLAKFNGTGLTVNGTFVSASDRTIKTNFQAVAQQEALQKIAALPITTWEFTNAPGTRHLGPMAQDFKAAFGLGDDDKHISMTDEVGAALAAIQGLQAELKDRDAKIADLERRLTSLERLQK
ncbi:MAG TPA: tail fiber domain-containing protein [Verrucomicrobiae bacterium]|nr:tail fiber domain-containing protein [Verrucomicrobiae bacterium]